MAKKAVVIGLDAPIPKTIKKLAEAGKLPAFKKLIENGTWAENCLVPHPTITPPNWTTIVTGSWPGTHGVTCYGFYKLGDPGDKVYNMATSSHVKSEYIWNAIEKVNKKTIVLNYPTTWPPTMKDGIQIAGAGLGVNTWQVSPKGELLQTRIFTICGDQIVSNETFPLSEPVKIKPAENFKGAPPDALEIEIDLKFRNSTEKVKPKKYYLLISQENGKFLKVDLCKSKDINTSFTTLRKGQWSKKLSDEFETETGIKTGEFKCKLLHLSNDGKEIKFYISPICQTNGWGYPESICEEIKNLNLDIPPLQVITSWEARGLGWIDYETLLEIFDMEHQWLAEVAVYLIKKYEWTLFFMHAHCPDFLYHNFINELEAGNEEFLRYEEIFYQSLDKMIGKIVENLDTETIIIITSDHGACPTQKINNKPFGFNPWKILKDAGLMATKKEGDKEVIDWTKTKAFPQRSVYVYINLKGKFPHGIVDESEYGEICEKVISLFYDYTDPLTGKKPVVFALKKEDARMIGLYGDDVGDVIYGVKPEVEGEHGRQITTGDYGIGSMKGLFLISGPNIKKNLILKRTVWLTDIVPTICYLLALPVPRDCEGAIIYQCMEDPNFMIRELEKLKKDYERLETTYKSAMHQIHRY